MSDPCRFLEWDSAFFEHRIARLNFERLYAGSLAAVEAWCVQHTIECLYFAADADHPPTVRLAEDNGFRLVEARLIFEGWLKNWHPATRPTANEDIRVRPAVAADIPALQRIACNSYRGSRFYFDPCFGEARCQEYYQTWIKNSVEDAQEMSLVAEAEGRQVGYITGRAVDDGPEGEYLLTAVDEQARTHGIGQELFRSGLDWFVRHGVEHVVVATQIRNIPSQRLIERHGFLSKAARLYYHKWFVPCQPLPV